MGFYLGPFSLTEKENRVGRVPTQKVRFEKTGDPVFTRYRLGPVTKVLRFPGPVEL